MQMVMDGECSMFNVECSIPDAQFKAGKLWAADPVDIPSWALNIGH
jgi:hypothetical protein